METYSISKKAIKNVLLDYMNEYKKRPLYTLMAFVLPAIGTTLVMYVPPLIVARVVNIIAAGNPDMHKIYSLVILLAVLWALGEVAWRVGIHFMIRLEEIGIKNMSEKMFWKLTSRDYDFYTNNFVGTLVKRGVSYSRNFDALSDTLAYNVLSNVIPIIFASVILWRYSPWIPIALLGWLTFTVIISIPIIKGRAILVSHRHDASSRLSGYISDAVTNMLAIKSFAKEGEEAETFSRYTEGFTDAYKKSYDYQNLRFEAIISPIYIVTNVFGLLMAIFFTLKFGLAVGTVLVVFTYYSQITRIFWEINHIYRNIESSITEAAEFAELILPTPKIEDETNAKDLVLDNGVIDFKNVDFAYERKETAGLFLHKFNLTIPAKQKIGLVGPSGGGKTTITKLLLRFVDVTDGTLAIDGQDIKKVTQSSLRRLITYVPQEPLLFHRSLYENIAYGNDGATKEEVVEAAKRAHAHEFIETLPKGYETLVGERGVKLSGGQRQRVAIARALLKQAPIIILDEATSSLDSESEKYIQNGLVELMKDKTAIVIAHRLSTIKHLDRIIVLDKGGIVQDGTHDELIKHKGLYAKLWSHQSGEILED